MISKEDKFKTLERIIQEQKKTIGEIEKLKNDLEVSLEEEKILINSQIKKLEENLKRLNEKFRKKLKDFVFSQEGEELEEEEEKSEDDLLAEKRMKSIGGQTYSMKEILPKELEKETLRKLKKAEEKKKEKKEVKKTSNYSKISSLLFSNISRKLLGKDSFKSMENQLIKANLDFTPVGYVSVILMTTLLSGIVAAFLFLFFLFFNFGAMIPIITRATESVDVRFFKVFWILFVVPIGTFFTMYVYPSLEKKAAEFNIDTELPFATIHMSAISGSMINPIKIFEIIISTKEYPALEKEFKKMINEINLYGYDLVSAMKNTSKNSPSKKLSELLNGLVTTINSGGDLPKFFEKRAETLLFNHRLEQQKAAKAAETFMDIYISLVIAAPMILMLLMMIMKISGLGIAMSIMSIALMIILGVVIINIIFLTFLQIKRNK
ncbi:MAG TPA: type II secretion system F family protein [Candidatus Nanoarchaeia archaeon]|nr:type II secretion system F family protein [Candidatus Nanoarchaeia archaeon]